MSVAYDPTWAFGFLFRLAAQAHRLRRKEVLRRLLVGLSNRFDAVACSYYSMDGSAPSRSTEPAQDAVPLAGEIRRLSAAVAKLCRSQGRLVSALDLSDEHAEDRHRMEAVLGPCDTFAFPLVAEGRLGGCIVLCLRGDQRLGAVDLVALPSIGECLDAALEMAQEDDELAGAA